VPQDEEDSAPNASHVPVEPPLQQPLGQVVASHEQVPVPVSHTPFAQTLHAAPPAPHCEADSDAYATHVPAAEQQPPGHELASHTHVPVVVLHSWPAPHAPQATPAAPHWLDVSVA
jgi:hypothetical protein